MEGFAGSNWAERVFRDNGRAFYVFIWVGANDRQELQPLLNALNSIRVAR
jgi:hypothetical protein